MMSSNLVEGGRITVLLHQMQWLLITRWGLSKVLASSSLTDMTQQGLFETVIKMRLRVAHDCVVAVRQDRMRGRT